MVENDPDLQTNLSRKRLTILGITLIIIFNLLAILWWLVSLGDLDRLDPYPPTYLDIFIMPGIPVLSLLGLAVFIWRSFRGIR